MMPAHPSPLFSVVIGFIFVFQMWMLVDSIRRRAPIYWPILIFFFSPAALLYFFTVKAQDLKGGRRPSVMGAGGSSIEDLVELVATTPSELNKLTLADRLAAERRFPEAIGRYRDVLRVNKDSKEALHGVARALLSLGRPLEAVEELATLMELDPEFRDYSAALDYAEALWQAKQYDDTIGLLTGLVSVSKRINHRMALAHYLKEHGDAVTARTELDEALREFASSPDFVKQRDQRWAERAKKLRAELN